MYSRSGRKHTACQTDTKSYWYRTQETGGGLCRRTSFIFIYFNMATFAPLTSPHPALLLSNRYLKLYKLEMTEAQHVALVKLTWELAFTPGIDFEPQHQLVKVLLRLLRKDKVLPPTALELPWQPLYSVLTTIHDVKVRNSILVPKQ